MIRKLNLQDPREAAEILLLQQRAYRQEAELIGSEAIPPLSETLEALQQSAETFYGFLLDGRVVGAISYKREEELLDIYRVMVHPDWFRRGIARTLLHHVEHTEQDARRIIVSTGSLNAPACAFYAREGFTATGEEEIVPNLWITHFEKTR